MHFIPIWLFFAVVITGLAHNWRDELAGLFLWVNISMAIGALTYWLYDKIFHYEFRNVYRYLEKYINGKEVK